MRGKSRNLAVGCLISPIHGVLGHVGNGTVLGIAWAGGAGLPFASGSGGIIINVVHFGPTMAVADTTGFPASGAVSVSLFTGGAYVMTYTGRTTSSGRGEFTGVTGGPGPDTFTALSADRRAAARARVDESSRDDLAGFASAGSAIVAGQTITYTGVTAGSGPGSLTGVSGITTPIAPGAAIVGLVPIGAASVPIANTAGFALLPGSASRRRATIGSPGDRHDRAWRADGRHRPHGGRAVRVRRGTVPAHRGHESADRRHVGVCPGGGLGDRQRTADRLHRPIDVERIRPLTGVTGITAVVPSGSPIAPIIPIGSVSLPIADTAVFLTGGWRGECRRAAITYTGRSASSGPGVLTGVTGITAAVAIGAAVAVVVPIGATSIPVVETAPFNAAGGVLSIGGVSSPTARNRRRAGRAC